MKACSKCKEIKDNSEFGKRGTGLQPYCKLCNKLQRKLNYENNRERDKQYTRTNRWRIRAAALKFVMQYVSDRGGCSKCGETDFRCIDFNHLDQAQKKYNISDMIAGGYSTDSITQELDKCEILCANCHRKFTATQLNWYRNVLPHV